MSGLFPEWQPRYAAHGIPTFPVRFEGSDKKPCVTGYMKAGLNASRKWAQRFPDNDAFGFALGKRTNITVLDVDTKDERVRDDAFSRFGQPAIAVRTLRGRWQGWYRYNGEPRLIKPWPGEPIDLLGDGFIVAPPSKSTRSGYEIIHGGLDDLDQLPVIQGLPAAPTARAEKIGEGRRNKSLFDHLMRQAPHCDDLDALLDVARTYAEDRFVPPLSESEIARTAASVWSYERRGLNMFGRGRAVMVGHDLIDQIRDPDAMFLYLTLCRHHSDRVEFVLANAMAQTMGWRLSRFRNARDRLVDEGIIICIHAGGRGPNDPPRYRWAKVYGSAHQS
jgi:Bifunctional DNA primase/polymerase, N-terminal/Primase C terminal 1 (PriCT-1)